MDDLPWHLLRVSLLLVGVGLLAWSGRTRGFVLRGWPSPTVHLAPLYLGIAGLLTAFSRAGPGWLSVVMLTLAGVSFAVGLLAVVWLPRALQPSWLRNRRRPR